MPTFRHLTALATTAALIASPIVAQARSADSLRDLVGARAAGAEQDLESRGWVVTDGHKGASSAFTYWWNPSRKNCVMVATRDGRYDSITDVTPADCNQKSGGSSAGTAVAGAVAIAALAAALSHKAGHHENGQHSSDSQTEAEYERGFSDGLHNQPYRNLSRSDSYGSGYQNGVDQRDRDSGGGRNQGYGYGDSREVPDLVGDRAAGAEDELLGQGFRNVDGFASGNDGKGTVWWNRGTRQCLQMIVVNGRVDSLNDIGSHAACR